MKRFVDRGGLWVVAQTVLTVAAVALGPMQRSSLGHWSWSVLGIGFIVTGAIFGIAGVKALGRCRTPYPEPLTEGHLIRVGIYSRVRHPLYTSLMLITPGWAIAWGSPWCLAAALALALLLAAKAVAEEQWLLKKYPEYSQYAKEVPRFLPFLF